MEVIFALQCPRVLGAVIMSRLPITPPKRGQLCKGDRRVLAGCNHPTRITGERKRVPHKIEEKYSGGGFAEVLPHTGYVIYAKSGEVFKRVRNARNANDGTPTVVALPAGAYKVEAEAVDCDSDRVKVLMTVVIRLGQATLAHLEGDWNPKGQHKGTEVVNLPCGRAIGWRAPETEIANRLAVHPN